MSANNYMMVLELKEKPRYSVYMVDADTGSLLGRIRHYKSLRHALRYAQTKADLECEYGLRVELI